MNSQMTYTATSVQGRMATHSANLFHKGSFHSPICTTLNIEMDLTYLSSANVKFQKAKWLEPSSVVVRPDSSTLPVLTDIKAKQMPLILPNHEPISVTPMVAIGMFNEIIIRNKILSQKMHGLDLDQVHIKFNAKDYAAYNEIVGLTEGYFAAFGAPSKFRNSLSYFNQQTIHNVQDNEVCLGLALENTRLSSNMVASGFPSVFSLGGFFDFLTEETGCENVKYAIGYYDIEKNSIQQHGQDKPKSRIGFYNTKQSQLDHRQGIFKMYLVIQAQNSADALNIKKWVMQRNFKVAAGQVQNKFLMDHIPNDCLWLYDADMQTMQHDFKERELSSLYEGSLDSLDYALALYRSNAPHLKRFYTVNTTGLALLANPYFSEFSRAESSYHAWAEVVFALVYLQGSFDRQSVFWSKQYNEEKRWMKWSTLVA